MKRLVRRLLVLGRERPGFIVLLFLLFVISLSLLKSKFYLIGWDTFSPYFNLTTNIFRTFFATWREYRGLGVASDSEVTDLFRQLFYFLVSPIFPQQLHDQLYTLVALYVGSLSMYAFSCILFKKCTTKDKEKFADAFGFLSAFFYLYNLNTLATFYFPMAMYVNRFFALPTIFLIFFLLIEKKVITRKLYFLSVFLLLLTSGTYLTATILITVVIALNIFGVFQSSFKRFLVIFTFYLGLQSFWLFPFLNYAVQKSSIVRLAPNFINVNEIQLNRGKSFYELGEQLIFYPNFFATELYDIAGMERLRFHELATLMKKPFYRATLWIFPILYIAGALMLLRKHRGGRRLLFIPFTIFLFLFLSLKEFSPLGFLYNLLSTIIPYFNVLFRFGDTKFHPMIAFSGSLSAAFVLILLTSYLRRAVWYFLVGVLLVAHAFVFKSYFTGKFIAPYKYNVLPPAYADIAGIVNKDKDYFRVLHLPQSREEYWKSYAWGMFGSSFLHFMLDHPLIDRTFEPASMENGYLHKKLDSFLDDAHNMQEVEEKTRRVSEFASLLQRIGVKYIIFDGSVEASMPLRGVQLWGTFGTQDAKAMVEFLKDLGLAKMVKRYEIDLRDYDEVYTSLKSLTEEEKRVIAQNPLREIELIQLTNVQPHVQFLRMATNIDPQIDNLLASDLVFSDNHWVQDSLLPSTIFPFKRRNLVVDSSEREYIFEPIQAKPWAKAFRLQLPEVHPSDKETQFIDVYAEKDTEKLTIRFFIRRTPTIGGVAYLQRVGDFEIPVEHLRESSTFSDLHRYISDWYFLPQKQVGALRLRIGDYVLPVPNVSTQASSYVGTVVVKGAVLPIDVLSFNKTDMLDVNKFSFTDNPNCFFDKLRNASYSLMRSGSLDVTSQNQSTCLFFDLKPILDGDVAHAEVTLSMIGKSSDLDGQYGLSFTETSKPHLKEYVTALPKPNMVRVCVKDYWSDSCYNLHPFVNVVGETDVVFPLEKPLLGNTNMTLLLSLKNTGYQWQEVTLKRVGVDTYVSVASDTLVLPSLSAESVALRVDEKEDLTLRFPKALSPYSFFFSPTREGLYGYNGPCEMESGYRTVREFKEQLLTFEDNCYIEFFQPASFSSDNFYLWLVSYNLLSGKYPRLHVGDGFSSYKDEYASLYQGYPDIAGFKQFQLPEMWYDSFFASRTNEEIEELLSNAPFHNAYTYIYPNHWLSDNSSKQFVFHQDSENEGAILLKGFNVQPLPSSWVNFRMETGEVERTFAVPWEYSFRRLLPSLMEVTLKSKERAPYLLLFNEGFDKQWKLYDSLLGVLFGVGESSPLRCDGYANCFVLQEQNISEGRKLYIFYTPERLSVLGWFATIATTVLFSSILIKKRFINL